MPLTVNHDYNAAGQRILSRSPGGQTLEYQWLANRLHAIYLNGQPLLTQIGYEVDGQINGWTWGNFQTSERHYDLAGRVVSVSLGFDAATQLADTRYYSYDRAGRLIDAIDDVDPALNQHYDYDELDRLIGSQRGAMASRTGTTQDDAVVENYHTAADSNRLQSRSGAKNVSYSYDAAGNLLSDGVFNYRYNAAGRLVAAAGAGQTIGYGYDAIGQRVGKTVAGHLTQYFYDEQGHLAGEYDAGGQLIQEIIWLNDWPVAVLKPGAAPTPDVYATRRGA